MKKKKKNKRNVEVFHSPITSVKALAFLRGLETKKDEDVDKVISEAIDASINGA